MKLSTFGYTLARWNSDVFFLAYLSYPDYMMSSCANHFILFQRKWFTQRWFFLKMSAISWLHVKFMRKSFHLIPKKMVPIVAQTDEASCRFAPTVSWFHALWNLLFDDQHQWINSDQGNYYYVFNNLWMYRCYQVSRIV